MKVIHLSKREAVTIVTQFVRTIPDNQSFRDVAPVGSPVSMFVAEICTTFNGVWREEYERFSWPC